MILNYVKSQSSVYPELLDTTSSNNVVYLRKNVTETTNTDADSNDSFVCYTYEEAKLTKKEYEQYLTELSILDIQKQRADIDYIALMMGIELEE